MKWWIAGLTALVGGTLWSTTTVQAQPTVIQSATSVPVTTLDSGHYASTADAEAIHAQSEGLYTYDAQNHIMLGLARAKPTVNRAKTVYTFQLRHTKWSNGEPLTASDFVYAWRRVVDPATQSRNANKLAVIKNATAITAGKKSVKTLGVQAVGKYTVKVTLASPTPYLAQLLEGRAFAPLNQHFVEQRGRQYGTSSANAVSNGPFIVKNWQGSHDHQWTYAKNPYYWNRKSVKVSAVNIKMISSSAKAAAQFDQGKLDYAQLTDQTLQRYVGQKVLHQELTSTEADLFFNTRKPQLSNVHLRRAIAYSYNKVLLTRGVLRDGSAPLNGLIPVNLVKDPVHHKDYRDDDHAATSEYNLQQAQHEWRQAKQQLKTQNVKLQLLVAKTDSNLKMAKFMQAQMQHNLPGLTVTIKAVPLAKRIVLEGQGKFQLVIGTWTPSNPDPADYVGFYRSNSLANVPKYSNAKYDQGLNEITGQLATKPMQRWRKVQQLERQAIKEAVVVSPMYQQGLTYLENSKITGLQFSPYGSIVNYQYVQLKD